MKTHRLQTRKNRGFTLVEMMLVLGIIALLVGAGAVMFTDVLGTGKQGRAKADISTLTTALRTYEAQSLLLPTTEQGLNALDFARLGNRVDAQAIISQAILRSQPRGKW